MDKYDYVIEKPELNEETLAHFGLTRTVHKYIDRYMGKNGKWVYKYAKNVSKLGNKAAYKYGVFKKQIGSAASTMKRQANSATSKAFKSTGAQYSKVRKRLSSLLPGLYKKRNRLNRQIRSQAAGVKLVARNKKNKLKKQAKNAYSTAKRKTKSTYYKAKSKKAELDAWSARVNTGVKKTDTTRRTNTIRTGYYNRYEAYGIRPGTSGKANSYSGQEGTKSVKTTKVKVPNSRPRARKKRTVAGTARVYKHR